MVALQVLSKVVLSKQKSLLTDNGFDVEYFTGYEEEYEFIINHLNEYGNIPDKETVLSKFPELELVEVTESDQYLIDALSEEHLYYGSVPVIKRAAELMKNNADDAVQYLNAALSDLSVSKTVKGVDIIKQATERFEEYQERTNPEKVWTFTTGFKELDNVLGELERGEELLVIFSRTGNGKTWVLEKMCAHIWNLGFNVGYISPEMSANKIGYRFDTLVKHFSNKSLMKGHEAENYEDYIKELSESEHSFLVASPKHFQKKMTVSKLRAFVLQNNLDVLAIDGITYMTDERYRKGDNKNTSLTNISEDLMELSIELKIPIIIVCQSNRSGDMQGEDSKGTPELSAIRDSDGISHNASKIISLRKKEESLEIGIKKNRYGETNGSLLYKWGVDIGDFVYIPSDEDATSKEDKQKNISNLKNKFKDKKQAF